MKSWDIGSRTPGETAAHINYDPVVMSTLLDIGAAPTLKDSRGQQALISFLFGYKDYPNKAYFRTVVERMLKMGADVNNCFADGSACVLSVAQKYGDKDLQGLLLKYKK